MMNMRYDECRNTFFFLVTEPSSISFLGYDSLALKLISLTSRNTQACEIFSHKWQSNDALVESECWFRQMITSWEGNDKGISEENIIMTVMEFFFAGSVTTSFTLLVFLNVMADYP